MASSSSAQMPQKSAGPASFADVISRNAGPALQVALQLLDRAGPMIEAIYAAALKAHAICEPYLPDVLPLLLGFGMLFFGGHFPLLIAAIEAYRIAGWQSTQRALSVLYQQYTAAMAASKKDDLADDNHDGIPDVKQISSQQLVTRKLSVFLKATNPTVVSDALYSINAGMTAVMCSLRSEFAQTITLGVSLGDIFTQAADTVLRPVLQKLVAPEYHKWLGVIISYACRCLAVSIAWWCQRVISTLHSSMRGAQLLLQGLTHLARRHGMQAMADVVSSHGVSPIVSGTIGFVGVYAQLVHAWRLPFPMGILLLPLRMLEWVLAYFVSFGPSKAQQN